MLTKKQQKWLAHLSNEKKIKIVPFDPASQKIFEKVKKRIRSKLGKSIKVVHCGATGLGISGQDEIDIYIPVSPRNFNSLITPLTELFGNPMSHHPLERVRYATFESGKFIEVFLINKECSGWKNGIKFERYLKSHPKTLKAYEKLKEEGDGLGGREYYTRKIEFINDILNEANKRT